MLVDFLQNNFRELLLGSGVSLASVIAIYNGYKRFTKPSIKSARKNLMGLIKFLRSIEPTDSSFKPVRAYTLYDLSILITDRDLKWGEDSK